MYAHRTVSELLVCTGNSRETIQKGVDESADAHQGSNTYTPR